MATIAENLNEIKKCKRDMKASLLNKGVEPTGGLNTYADTIDRIQIGVQLNNQNKTVDIIKNGTETVSYDPEYTGLEQVTINTNIPEQKPEMIGQASVTSNGLVTFTPTPGSVFSEMNVDVQVPSTEFDFTGTGYEKDMQDRVKDKVQSDLDYTAMKYKEWDPSNTSAKKLYEYDRKLIYAPVIDTKNVTNMEEMYDECSGLMFIPKLDTNNVTTLRGTFSGCHSLVYIPTLNVSKIIDLENAFNGCESLQNISFSGVPKPVKISAAFSNCESIASIPYMDTSLVTDMSYLFFNCESITTIPQLDTSEVSNVSHMFYDCKSLKSLPKMDFGRVTDISNFFGHDAINTLTDLGGFTGWKFNWVDSHGLAKCPNLTKQSVLNVINELYDFRANGDLTTTRVIEFHANSLALLSESEIAIATNKGWNLVS